MHRPARLTVETAKDHDFVIAGWCSQYGNDGYPKRESLLFGVRNQLGPEFRKPIVAMDYVSSHIRTSGAAASSIGFDSACTTARTGCLVHSGEFKQGCGVGMVADGHGFEDSPDCERVGGGINSKGPMAVAMGRQANLLQWGFYGVRAASSSPPT